MKIIDAINDFVIAPKANCLGCQSALGSDNGYLCASCYSSLSPLYKTYEGSKKICNLCGKEIIKLKCRCGGIPKNAYNVYSAYYFELPVSTLIKAFKYKSVTTLSEWMAEEMICALKNERDFDLITCVPMHPIRKIKRGFNQSELLAKIISEKMNLPFVHTLRRRRFTRKQAALTGTQRRTNLIHAFSFRETDIKNKHILLVDDVRTTGTTLISCARVLMENGARKVSAVTLACTKG